MKKNCKTFFFFSFDYDTYLTYQFLKKAVIEACVIFFINSFLAILALLIAYKCIFSDYIKIFIALFHAIAVSLT